MSEPALPVEAPLPVVTAAPPERKAQVETLVKGILQHMDYPARMETKDMPDGGIGIALHFEGELPGIVQGKPRSWLVDCIQFLVNKAINRPNVEKRWVSLGVNAFPEPRPEKSEKPAAPPPNGAEPVKKADAPKKAEAKKGETPKKPEVAPKREDRPSKGSRNEPDERSLEVKEDAASTKLFTMLAQKAAKTGRFYAVMSLSADDRARALKAVEGVKGVSAKAEGEGIWRRLTFVPATPTPMPSKKQVMPDYDDEEE